MPEPVTIPQLTPKERDALLIAASISIDILDNGEDG